MGFKAELKELFHFIYKAPFDNGLTEHELDHDDRVLQRGS
jgi:isopentenyl-diphosphate delta-isomerase